MYKHGNKEIHELITFDDYVHTVMGELKHISVYFDRTLSDEIMSEYEKYINNNLKVKKLSIITYFDNKERVNKALSKQFGNMMDAIELLLKQFPTFIKIKEV